jgi:hypothetical protein
MERQAKEQETLPFYEWIGLLRRKIVAFCKLELSDNLRRWPIISDSNFS